MFHVNHKTKGSPIIVNATVNGKLIPMELDTGSSVSLIPETTYKKIFNSMPPLQQTTIRLKTYSGEKIIPLGMLTVPVCVNNHKGNAELLVVPQDGPALFGRDWLKNFPLNWQEIKVLQETKTSGLDEILDKHKSIFKDELGKLEKLKASIYITENCQPKFHKPRNVPYAMRDKVEKELDRLQKEGIISSVKHSDWASPIVPVQKKSGQVRICGDYKATINPVMKVEQYPLPRIEDIFASLSGGQKFTKIHLKQAYLQMEVDDASKELLTINTHKGLFRYNRLPFGVASAPAIWQRAMDQVLQNIPFTSCILDDMTTSGRSTEEHLNNLDTVLERLNTYNLRVNREKCEFFEDSVTYCGHIINLEGLQKSPDKISAVLNAPKPENTQQLR
ncbi:uncharacterized protein K02A2.6-like isoform X2 [Anneissia japonica]|uniref:uncharacterized protein K02A2.6-like isoform X2 n=1 Tax=Anneissia japonica TaxID=1529436 RepID=UPI0014258034|nr:uncharacterized protein K02A2.6-like isoform X2 [Anneissia japonica]